MPGLGWTAYPGEWRSDKPARPPDAPTSRPTSAFNVQACVADDAAELAPYRRGDRAARARSGSPGTGRPARAHDLTDAAFTRGGLRARITRERLATGRGARSERGGGPSDEPGRGRLPGGGRRDGAGCRCIGEAAWKTVSGGHYPSAEA